MTANPQPPQSLREQLAGALRMRYESGYDDGLRSSPWMPIDDMTVNAVMQLCESYATDRAAAAERAGRLTATKKCFAIAETRADRNIFAYLEELQNELTAGAGEGTIHRLSIPGNLCGNCGTKMGDSIICPGCRWTDPPTRREQPSQPRDDNNE